MRLDAGQQEPFQQPFSTAQENFQTPERIRRIERELFAYLGWNRSREAVGFDQRSIGVRFHHVQLEQAGRKSLNAQI